MRALFVYCFLTVVLGEPRITYYSTPDGDAHDNLKEFNLWRHEYGKLQANGDALEDQFNNWKDNREFVRAHNAKNLGYTLEMNQFADIHHLNWGARPSFNQKMAKRQRVSPTECAVDASLPASVDWRPKNVVTKVKNQQQCGSCWAFSATGSMEGQHALKTGKLVSLSESQIVDCDVNGTDHGCMGGFMDGAFKYAIANRGIEYEKDYPYVPTDNPCAFKKKDVAATFSSYHDVTGGEEGLKKAVATVGPISVGIDASCFDFASYSGGVYYNPECSQTVLDHGVLVVGYGTTKNGTDYWIVKNSWGGTWGKEGYILMARNRNNSCGIATEPSYPIV